MSDFALLSFLAIVGMAAIHMFTHRMTFLNVIPRNRWLSVSGGVAVAYVVMQILPTLAKDQQAFDELAGGRYSFLKNHIYLMTLIGLGFSYGTERMVKRERWRNRAEGKEDAALGWAFGLSLFSFAAINFIIAYLMADQARTPLGLLLFAVAMGLKFLVSDFGLFEDHKQNWTGVGRWVVTAADFGGWAVGRFSEIPRVGLALIRAFLVGGIIMNVMKEELPQERQSSFWAFALGALAYAALLLAT